MPIVTPRLTLDVPKHGDGAAVASAMAETWDVLFPWFHQHLGPRDEETDARRKEEFLARSLADTPAGRRLLLLGFDRADGSFVIWSGFPNIDWEERRLEVDYWVRQSKQGQGLATEAVNGCLHLAFSAMGARAVTLGCAATNLASIAVATKLGFTPIARKQKSYVMPDGHAVDWHVYERTCLELLPPF